MLTPALVNGSAVIGTDTGSGLEYFDGSSWVAVTGNITIPAGQTSLQVRTTVTDDTLDENAENFTLTLAHVSGTIAPAGNDFTGQGTINDDDPTPVLNIDDVTVNEEAGTMTFTVTLDAASGLPVTVDYTTAATGTAEAADFTATSGTLNFAAGVTSQTITVAITNDNVYEGSEDFHVNLSAPTNATITDNQGVGTILDDGTGPGGTDDDRPTVSINDVTVTEGADTHVVFTVNLSNASDEAVVLTPSLVSGTATVGTDTGAGLEYFDGTSWVAVTGDITIPAGQTSLQVRTTVTNDSLDESSENFTLTLAHVSGTVAPAGNDFTGQGTINDDDPAPGLSIDDVTVNEAAGTMTFTVTLDAASGLPVTVDYTSAATGTAEAADFTATSGTLNFAAGVTSQTITVAITNDNVYEGSENFHVNLSTPTNATITDSQGVGTILDDGTGPGGTDDDRPTVSINDATVTEGTDAHAVFTLTLGNPTDFDTELSLSLHDITANIGTDTGTTAGLEYFDGTTWQPLVGSVTIPAGETSLQVRTTITDDLIDEVTETFTLKATPVQDFSFNGAAENMTDQNGYYYAVTSGLFPDGNLTPNGDRASGTGVIMHIHDDASVWGTRWFQDWDSGTIDGWFADTSGLALTLGDTGITVYDNNGIDDDTFPPDYYEAGHGGVSFSMADNYDHETAGYFALTGDTTFNTVSAYFIGTSGLDVNDPRLAVHLNIFDASISDADPAPDPPLTYSPTDNSFTGDLLSTHVGTAAYQTGCMNIEDSGETLDVFGGTYTIFKATYTLDAPMTLGSGEYYFGHHGSFGPINSATGTGTIIDDDPAPTVMIGDATATEGNSLLFDVTLSNPSSEDIVLNLSTTGVTATDGSDYENTNFEYSTDGGVTWNPAASGTQVTISAGQTMAQVRVDSMTDSLVELDETFQLEVASVVSGSVANSSDTGTGFITDDDAATVSIDDVAQVEGDTGTTAYTFTISIDEAVDVDVDVDWTTVLLSGQADATDLAAQSGTATITAGSTSAIVTVNVNGDLTIENDETFQVALSNTQASTRDVTIGGGTGLGTILNDDSATISIAATQNGNETGPVDGQFTVTLGQPSDTPTAISFAVSGTATEGNDFATTATKTVTIPAGSTTATITIDVTDDTEIESIENVTVTLNTITAGHAGSISIEPLNSSDTFTITDNDSGQWNISGPLFADEGTTAQYTISLSGNYGAGETATVDINLSDITTSSSDYADVIAAVQAAAGAHANVTFDGIDTLTFTAPAGGGSMADFVINLGVTDDAFIEGSENFEIELSNAASTTGVTTSIGTDTATTTINDTQGPGGADDGPATWSITGTSHVDEGNDSTYTLSLAGMLQADETVTVDLSIGDIDTNNSDYGTFTTAVQAAVTNYMGPGTLSWNGTTLTFTSDGNPMGNLDIDLPITQDGVEETHEDFRVALGNPTSTTGAQTLVDPATTVVTTTIDGHPIGENDTSSTIVNTPVSGNVLTNDSDPDGDPLTVTTTAVTPPTNGAVTLNPDGTYTYTPNSGFTGTDSFEYEVCDDGGNCTTAIVTIKVRDTLADPNNTPPVATNDNFGTHQGTPVSGSLTSNDGDPDGDVISINTTPLTTPANGTVTINSDGTFTYTPTGPFTGTDSFTYEITDPSGSPDTAVVTINVTPDANGLSNDPPYAGDDTGIGQKNTLVTGDLLANDSDPNGDPLTINPTPVTGPSHGAVTISADGAYTYTPNNDFTGTDSFTYEVCDNSGACDIATVTVTIFNNPPEVVTLIPPQSDSDGDIISVDVSTHFSDPNGDTLTFSAIGLPPGLAIDPNTGAISGTLPPHASQGGPYDVEITVDDGDRGVITSSFVWNVDNPAPDATDDSLTTTGSSVITGNVITADNGNGVDSDPDGDSLTVTAVNGSTGALGSPITLPSGAILTISTDGSYAYDPNGQFDSLAPGQSAIDAFTYTISDGDGGSDTATVVVTINGSNEPPVAGDDYVTTSTDVPVVIPVLNNDTGPSGDPLTVILLGQPENGSATVNPDGTITFVPNPGFEGETTFEYLIEDGNGGSSTATVTVLVELRYSFDSFNDPKEGFQHDTNGVQGVDRPMLTKEIFTLAPEPIFSGHARPGSQIIGRIYDTAGRLIGESRAMTDPGGNWLVQFQGVEGFQFHRIEFEQTAGAATDMYGYLGLNPADNTYQAMQPLTEYEEPTSVEKVLRDSPENTLERLHGLNNRPVGFGQ